jgi:hypothetical protein
VFKGVCGSDGWEFMVFNAANLQVVFHDVCEAVVSHDVCGPTCLITGAARR